MVFGRSGIHLHKQAVIAACILIVTMHSVSAQERQRSEAPPFRERLFFGGSFGLQIGTITDIELSPVAGFWVLPRLALAAGPNYRFYKDPLGRTDIYGGRVYSEFAVIRDLNSLIPLGLNLGIFIHLEDEYLSLDPEFWMIPSDGRRYNVNTLLAGAGISQPVGRRASINMMALWALNEGVYDIYSSPELRVTFTF